MHNLSPVKLATQSGACFILMLAGFANAEKIIPASDFIGLTTPAWVAVYLGRLFLSLTFGSGFACACFVIQILWHSLKASRQFDGAITFECLHSSLPDKIPANGKISFLFLQDSPENGLKSLGVSTKNGMPDEPINWDFLKSSHAYCCIVRNYSEWTALKIDLKIQASYLENVPTENGSRSGKEVLSREYSVPIPALKGNGNEEYIFYVVSLGAYFVNFMPTEKVKIERLGSYKNLLVNISYSDGSALKACGTLTPASFK